MKKKNGFISMSLIYAFFIVFIAIMFSLLVTYANERIFSNRITSDIVETQDKNNNLSCSFKNNEVILNESTTFTYLDGSTNTDDYVSTLNGSRKLSCPGFYEVEVYSRKGEDVGEHTGGRGGYVKAYLYLNSQTVLQYYVGAQTYIRIYENGVYVDPLTTTKGADGTSTSNGSDGTRSFLDRNYILEPQIDYNSTNKSSIKITYIGVNLT